MLLVNTETITGYRITESLGLVKANTIRAKHLGKDFMAALRSIVGGEIKEYTEMLTESRNESLRRLEAQAEKLNADAIVNIRFMTSQVIAGAAELLVFGTAVKVEKIEG